MSNALMNFTMLTHITRQLLAGIISMWVIASSAAEPEQNTVPLSIVEFLALDIPAYKVEKAKLEDAVEQLRALAKKQTGREAPPIGIVRYRKITSTEANPWEMEAAVSFELKHASAGLILRYAAELGGCHLQSNYWTIGLYELPALYHPRPLREFKLKDFIKVYGKPSKPIEQWLWDKLEAEDIRVWDIGVNEHTDQVFLATDPEGLNKLLRPKQAPSDKPKAK